MIILAGDVGGTKTILRLTEARSSQTLCEGRYRSQEFSDLSEVVSKFLATATQTLQQSIHPEIACFAIAGPVVNNSSVLTNLGWSLEASRLSQETKIPNISLINDFEAVGYGILELSASDVCTLQAGDLRPHALIAMLGAGTGLGEGFLLYQGERYRVYASEGGHADFAPHTELECQLLHYLLERSTTQHVSVEQIVSGNGILAIYQFLRHHTGLDQLLSGDDVDLTSKISDAALTAQDPLAEKALQIFVKAYGAEAGNLALKLLPYGGIYIAGGIAAKILPLMQDGTFLKAFLSKGRMSSLLEKIPVHIVLNPYVGLIGATRYARTMAIEFYPHHSNSLIDLS
ncbi:glucokinase [Leptolyngbya sp. AN03gr2]|uniref:glucokinase n=1 Tax=unclassified Leptolyngbya TaxID=2650499 RepID=UPI003D321C4B